MPSLTYDAPDRRPIAIGVAPNAAAIRRRILEGVNEVLPARHHLFNRAHSTSGMPFSNSLAVKGLNTTGMNNTLPKKMIRPSGSGIGCSDYI